MSQLTLDQRHQVGEVWARLKQGESRYAPDKYFSYNSVLTFTFDFEKFVQCHNTHFTRELCLCEVRPKNPKWTVSILWKKRCLCGPIWPRPLNYDLYLKSLHTTKPQPHCERSMGQIWQRGSRYASDKDFMYNCAMTSTLNLEKKLVKVTLYPKTVSWQEIADRQTDKQTEIELFFSGKNGLRHIDQMLLYQCYMYITVYITLDLG